MSRIDVLVVEDDPMVAEIHQNFINTLEGFRVVAVAGDGAKALELLETLPVRLLILDIFLPGLDGLNTLRKIREQQKNVDVIIVSASRDVNTVNEAIQAGAFDYIVKPFVYERLKASLESFRQMETKLRRGPRDVDQADIDSLFQVKSRKNYQSSLPKGLNPEMLKKVERLLRQSNCSLSAVEAAEALCVSRITARRYLEYLVASGKATMKREYQEVGRPINKY
ncbi:MAG TPA: response regulator [Aminobacterium sp.]|uniref:response regulator n=1 Tax=Aminobacterium TaxID=81466 RepID=UPI0004B0AD8E|nr:MULTISPECIES: response regulator [Aminobacterium]HCA41466.1 response regulator [Aminobacterium sp.]